MSNLNKKQKEKLVEMMKKWVNHLMEKKEEGEKMIKLKEAILGIAPDSIKKDLQKESKKSEKKIEEGMKMLNDEIKDAEAILEFVINIVKK